MDPEQWAIVELMGRHRTAGRVSSVTRYGAEMLHLEVPQEGGAWVVSDYAGSALYAITACTEDVARRVAAGWGGAHPLADLIAPETRTSKHLLVALSGPVETEADDPDDAGCEHCGAHAGKECMPSCRVEADENGCICDPLGSARNVNCPALHSPEPLAP